MLYLVLAVLLAPTAAVVALYASRIRFSTGHNFSVAPFFLRGIKRLIMWHAMRIHALVKRVAPELGVIFVDLFTDPQGEAFVKEPRRYYCPDGLHPSGEGYALWFAVLIAQVPLARFLAEHGSD